jgi:uncharacterized protein (DUF1499 family)
VWPPINDITTELEHASEAQRRAYPYVQPLLLKAAATHAFDAALTVARELGWRLTTVDPAGGRIEAVASTRLLRFKDDVTVTVHEVTGGTRVDVRSRSRVGRGDLGTNARRIRRFLTAVNQRVQ